MKIALAGLFIGNKFESFDSILFLSILNNSIPCMNQMLDSESIANDWILFEFNIELDVLNLAVSVPL